MMMTPMVTGRSARDGEVCWQAVLERDGRFDGRFVYAVRSTGIYCRPSCPSRRPGRAQAVFYGSPEAAERAGFRPCRRCQRSDRDAAERGRAADLVQRVCREIELRLAGSSPDTSSTDGGPLTLGSLSSRFAVTPRQLQRSFQRALGITPREYAEARRVDRFKRVLKSGRNVTEALYEAGYGSSRGLYERAASQLGMTPAGYGRGGRGMTIAFTIVDCPLGRLLVAATHRGICSVCLGESDAALQKALREEYPQAQVVAAAAHAARNGRDVAPRTLRPWVEALLRHLGGALFHLELPLDVRATAFQRRVWRELQAIPYGSTRSYSEVARRLGAPQAARAVARACASNPVAAIVPCHRVVRKDGSLGGYRWGLERKRALLSREAAFKLPAAGGRTENRSR